MDKMGFKNRSVALQKAWENITHLPYWQNHQDRWVPLATLQQELATAQSKFHEYWIAAEIAINASEAKDPPFLVQRPDIFISHTWRGPDAEFVDPLVKALRERGYTAWYDKEKGLKPGEMNQFLKDAILDAKNCVPIICQAYFEGHYTCYELEEIFRNKDPKHIFPLWWKDVDTPYLVKQAIYGDRILKTAGVSWKDCHGDIPQIVARLEEYMLAAEDLEIYNGVKLHESEAQALLVLEKCLGEPLPPLTDPMQLFGFGHTDHHVVEVRLHHTQSGIPRAPLNLPESFFKFKQLKILSAPLVELPAKIGIFNTLHTLDLHGGTLEDLPDILTTLPHLEHINLRNNPLTHVIQGSGLHFLEQWTTRQKLYRDVSPLERVILFVLQAQLGRIEPFPSVRDIHEVDIGYGSSNETVFTLKLTSMKLTFVPDSICNLKSLTNLDLSFNLLTSLPDSIGNLKSLIDLDLSSNKLISLLENIGNLIKLEILWIQENNLSSLPESIGNLIKLESLWIQKNNLSSLPVSIGNLKSLIDLDLSSNKLISLPESTKNALKMLKNHGCKIIR